MSTQPELTVVDPDAPRLIVVDTLTGEQIGTLDDYLAKYETQVRQLRAQITRMESDEEAAARKHKLWAEAQTAHEWWRLACWHPGTKFGAEEFYQALPRLKERNGLMRVLKAIAGAAYDPSTQRMKNGNLMVYDSWELLHRSRAKAETFHQRVYGGQDSEAWKAWLVNRIESNLKRSG